jgi:hypothetical protein
MTDAGTRRRAAEETGRDRLWTSVAVFASLRCAEAAVHELLAAGHLGESISVVAREAIAVRPGGPGADGPDEGGDRAVGGPFGPVALAIPGVGPVVAAGALGALLSGTLAGRDVGPFAGSFAAVGAPREDAERYEAAVRSGQAVVALEAFGVEATLEAAERMKRLGAHATGVYRTPP